MSIFSWIKSKMHKNEESVVETVETPVTETTKELTMSKDGRWALTILEGRRLKAYDDYNSKTLKIGESAQGTITIGVGHTGSMKAIGIDKDVYAGCTITAEQCDTLLTEDLKRFEAAVRDYVKVELTQCQFDAIVCFTFNIGIAGFKRSNLLKYLNEGKQNDMESVKAGFMGWTKANGDPNFLVGRRNKEIRVYTGDYNIQ
jgi:lysozyme